MASAWLAATLTGVAAYTTTAAKHAHFTTLAAVEPKGAKGCTAIKGLATVDDKWCTKNCDTEIPFCPPDMCECPGGNPIAGTDMKAPAESAAPVNDCQSVEEDRNDINDQWCMVNCNPVSTGTASGAPPNCPSRKCTCKGGNPTANGMPAHMTPEEYDMWRENNERKQAAAEVAEKAKEAAIAAEQEKKKEEARAASAEAADKQTAEKEEERQRVEAERAAAAQEVAQETQEKIGSMQPDAASSEAQAKAEAADVEASNKAAAEAHEAAIEAGQAAAAHIADIDAEKEQPEAVAATPVPAVAPRPLTDAEQGAQEEFKHREEEAAEARAAMAEAAEETRKQVEAGHEQAEKNRKQAEEGRLPPSEQQQSSRQQGQQEQLAASRQPQVQAPADMSKFHHTSDDGHMCGGLGAEQYPCHDSAAVAAAAARSQQQQQGQQQQADANNGLGH